MQPILQLGVAAALSGAFLGFVYGRFTPGSGAACTSNLVAAMIVAAMVAGATVWNPNHALVLVIFLVALVAGRGPGRKLNLPYQRQRAERLNFAVAAATP